MLITAAGGKDAVAEYCVTLVGPAPTHGARAEHPGAGASTHANGHRNTPSHPVGPPAAHRSAEPTDLPPHP